MKCQIREMSPRLQEDLEQLFGEKGACGGCWFSIPKGLKDSARAFNPGYRPNKAPRPERAKDEGLVSGNHGLLPRVGNDISGRPFRAGLFGAVTRG
jgi:hypothetical protein